MRQNQLQFLLLGILMFFSDLSFGRKIELDDLTNTNLVKPDDVQRALNDAMLIEKHRNATTKEWLLTFNSLALSESSTQHPLQNEIRSSQVLESFQRLSGMETISLNDISDFTLSPDSSRLLFFYANDLFVFSRVTNDVERVTFSAKAKEEMQFSPDGKLIAYIEEHNLWVVDCVTKHARKLTLDGNENLLYGKLDWVYQEEIFGRGNFRGYWWSRDSHHIAFLRIDESPVKKFPLEDDSADYGNLRLMSYPKAGTDNPLVDLGIVNASSGVIIWEDLSGYEPKTRLIVGVGFNRNGTQLLYQVQNRTQSLLHVRSRDMRTGQSATIWSEESSTWVNRLQDSFMFTDGGFYFLSELRGYAQIYFFSYEEKTAHQITNQDFEVREILNATGDFIYFVANEVSMLEDQG